MAPEKEKLVVAIDPWSVLMTMGMLLGLYILWLLNSLLFILFLSFIIFSTLKPYITKIQERFKVARSLVIIGVFFVVALILTGLGYLVIGNLSAELQNFDGQLVASEFLEWVDDTLPGDQQTILNFETGDPLTQTTDSTDIEFYSGETGMLIWDSLMKGSNVVVSVLGKTVTGFVFFFTVIIISFYMLSQEKDVFEGLLKFVPIGKKDTIKRLIDKVEKQLGAWFRAQLFLMLLIGGLTYIGLALPSLFLSEQVFTIGRFAVIIAVVASILELVPGIGPTITMIFAVILSIATGGDMYVPQTIYIFIYFTLIQNLEQTLIVPKLMKKAVGIDPIITILSVMGAYSLLGPGGAIIIVPIVAIAQIIVEFLTQEKLKE